MKNSQIKGTGNSRYLKSVSDLLRRYPDYNSFARALIDGTFPVDFNGINREGFRQIGPPLDANTLLSPSSASLFGGNSDTTPNEMYPLVSKKIQQAQETADRKAETIVGGSYVGTGTVGKGNKSSITLPFDPFLVLVGKANSDGTTMAPTDEEYGKKVGFLWFYSLRGPVLGAPVQFELTGNTLNWWYGGARPEAADQLNVSGKRYNYIALSR